jgi:hypothetical protein
VYLVRRIWEAVEADVGLLVARCSTVPTYRVVLARAPATVRWLIDTIASLLLRGRSTEPNAVSDDSPVGGRFRDRLEARKPAFEEVCCNPLDSELVDAVALRGRAGRLQSSVGLFAAVFALCCD